jgi:DNA repair ATPase RecN
MKEKRSTDAAVKPKLKRKFSLGEVTQQSSNSSVERYYNQLVKQLKKLERDGKRLDVMSDAYDEVKKLEAKVRQEIDRLTSDKDKIIQKLINKKNKEEENA